MPDQAVRDRDPPVTDEFPRMIARIDDAMVLPDQFLAGELGDRAELVVDVADLTLPVGDRYDSVLIQGGLQVPNFLESRLSVALLPRLRSRIAALKKNNPNDNIAKLRNVPQDSRKNV